ncbi:MAG: hypothetical protein ACI4E1_02315 [Lachnospira sp.]
MRNLRKLGILVLSLCMLMGLVACGGSSSKTISKDGAVTESSDADNKGTTGYKFDVQGTTEKISIAVDADMKGILAVIGEPNKYYEAASCAFDGLDKTYTYNHFEIYTYPDGDVDRVSAIILMDDMAETPEGASIGMKIDDVKKIYGTPSSSSDTAVEYKKDDMTLNFLVESGVITSIQYNSNVL